MEEGQIVVQLKARDKAALSLLYDKYAAALYGVAYRIIKDKEVTHEVIQDAFLKIWNRIDSYDASKGRLFTWILNIARNSAIDKIRSKEIKRSAKTDSIDSVVSILDQQGSTEIPIEGIGVRELINDLDSDQQFVLQKVYFEGFTHSEVSDEFDIPLGTVKSRIRSALKQLRKKVRN